MPLINSKAELMDKALCFVAGTDNANDNNGDNNIIFTINHNVIINGKTFMINQLI